MVISSLLQQWPALLAGALVGAVLSALLAWLLFYLQQKKWQLTVADQLEDSIQQRTLELQITLTELADKNKLLEQQNTRDVLTGVGNRAFFDQKLSAEIKRSRRERTTLALLMIDIDHFKTINDRYGHLYGDRVIRRVAHLMSEALRGEDDFIARFGGEEFVVVLPHTPLHSAMRVAERLRGLVELAGLPSLRAGDPNSEGMSATISCGVASGVPIEQPDPNALVDAADEALYRAKRDGRNIVRD